MLPNKIAAIRKQRGLSQTQLAEQIGTTLNMLGKLERGDRDLTSSWLTKLASALGCGPSDLIVAGEHSAAESGRPLSIDKAPDQPLVNGSGALQLKRVDLRLSMGDGTNLDDYFEEEPFEFDAVQLSGLTRAPSHRIIIASGDGHSMMPTLLDGDLVAIDTTDRTLNRMDKIWAISVHGAGGIKRLNRVATGRVEIISDNIDVPNRIVDEDDLHILGRIIWMGRKM